MRTQCYPNWRPQYPDWDGAYRDRRRFGESVVGRLGSNSVPQWRIQDLALSSDGPIERVNDMGELQSLLERLSRSEPRIALVQMTAGEYLHVGIGGPVGFLERVHSVSGWAETATLRGGTPAELQGALSVSFLDEGVDTEVRAKWIMPAEHVLKAVLRLYQEGDLPDYAEWRPS